MYILKMHRCIYTIFLRKTSNVTFFAFALALQNFLNRLIFNLFIKFLPVFKPFIFTSFEKFILFLTELEIVNEYYFFLRWHIFVNQTQSFKCRIYWCSNFTACAYLSSSHFINDMPIQISSFTKHCQALIILIGHRIFTFLLCHFASANKFISKFIIKNINFLFFTANHTTMSIAFFNNS